MATTPEARRARQLRLERRSLRVLINGRLVSTVAPEHGKASAYGTYSCRCELCTAANAQQVTRTRRTHYRDRVRRDGRWIYPAGPHGSPITYTSKGCRCLPCVEAIRLDRQ